MGSLMVNIKNSTIGRNCSGKRSEFGASIGSKYVTAIFFYTMGLKNIKASGAAVLCGIEPVTATMLSVFVVKEQFSIVQLTGVLMIFFSIVIIQTKDRKRFSFYKTRKPLSSQNRH